MTSWVRLGCAAAVAVAAIAALPGCSHNTVTSSTRGLAVTYLPSPSGSGRFEQGSMGFTNVNFLPTDPELAALTPGNDLTLGAGIVADLTSAEPKTLASVALAPGSYKVTQIRIVPPQGLVDETPDPAAPNCVDRVAAVPGSDPAFSQVPAEYVFDVNDGFQFNVRPGQTKLNIQVDVPATIAGFERAFTCQEDCGAGRACLTAFDAAAFRAVLLTTVKIE